ncbi:hypothetical protein DMP17_13895 [Pseudonocardia sp. TMWB2A]|uniref:helix-turn-helix domain-containing protein n=1 Tax=Pseudonocardia sp. TMWB2A TaxID=687430 RepID=UPI00307ED8E2
MHTGRWFSVGEACRILGVSRTTLLAAEGAALLVPSRTPGGHRRYSAEQLERYLGVAVPDLPQPDPAPPEPGAVDATSAAVVRDAVRPLARTLDAECAGVYLLDGRRWQLAGTAGVHRWLVERLSAGTPPPEVRAVLHAAGPRLFVPAETGFPDGRSAGHGVAVRVRAPDRERGLLFLVSRPGRSPLPAELDVVEAAADVLGLLVAQLDQNAVLRGRLRSIAALCPPAAAPAPARGAG